MIVYNLKGFIVNVHDSIRGMTSALQTWSNKAIVDYLIGLFYIVKKSKLVIMCVSVKLTSNYITISLDQCSESLTPFIDVVFGRNMSDDPNQLLLFFSFNKLRLQPSKHALWICWVFQKRPVFIVGSLGVQGNNLQIIDLR